MKIPTYSEALARLNKRPVSNVSDRYLIREVLPWSHREPAKVLGGPGQVKCYTICSAKLIKELGK